MSYEAKIKVLRKYFGAACIRKSARDLDISRTTIYRLLEGREIKPSTVDRIYAAMKQEKV